MRKMLVVVLVCLSPALWGQSSYTHYSIPLVQQPSVSRSLTRFSGQALTMPKRAVPFIAMNLEWRSAVPIPSDAIRVSMLNDGMDLSWTRLSLDEHTGNGETRFFSNMVFLEPETQTLSIQVEVDALWKRQFVDTLIIHLFDPGPTVTSKNDSSLPADNRDGACTCPPPTLTDRSQWCPDGSCLPHPSPEPVFPTHLIIHHSAGSNNSSDWAAVVRSIWNFHVNGNGWSDIGYNWLVDPNGVVYIGRGDDILGAHFCGKNSNTLGSCVMGDFTSVTPTENALNSLAELYAWKACIEDIDPLGSSFHPASAAVIPNVSGHRQSCNTSCPGDAFFPMLPQVREQIAQVIIGCDCDLESPLSVLTQVNGSTVQISWDPVLGGGAVVYRLQRKGPDDIDFLTLIETGSTTFSDVSVQPGQVYRYRILTLNGVCLSPPSSQSEIMIPDEWLIVQPTLVRQDVQIDIRNPTANPVRMTLTAVDGRQVWAIELGKSTQEWSYLLDMRNFAAGYYILHLEHGPIRKSVKLVKY